LIERLAAEGLLVSIDTWRAPVAGAALAAGAAMVNDPSGLADPGVAEACAEVGAALVITHTRVPPKRKGFPHYRDVVEDVLSLLGERAEEVRRRGVGEEQIVFDPGIDLAKTPAQSVEVLRRLDELRALGRPVLVAVSRKDFVGRADRAPAAGAGRGQPCGARRGGRWGCDDPSGARRRGGAGLPARARRLEGRERRPGGAASGRGAPTGARGAEAHALGVDVPLLTDDRDRAHGAIARGVEHVVERRSVGVDDHRLVLVVELEHVRRRIDAVARADAEGAVDRHLDSILLRELRHEPRRG
jgi:hypothetical protein